MSWPTARLAEVVQFLDSKRRPVKESERVEGPYPYYGANGQQGWIDDFIFDEPLILLAEDGGHFDNPSRGIAYAIEGKTWVNNHAHVLRATSRVDFRYLLHSLKNRDVRSYITGSTRGKLTKEGASRIEVPLPPMEEQRRIAAILDQAEELRAKRRATIALLDQLPQAIFLEMFGDPEAVKAWKELRISDFCHTGSGGTPSRQAESKYYNGGTIPWVKSGELRESMIYQTEEHITPLALAESSAKMVPAGAILLAMYGATVGRLAILGISAATNQAVCNIVPDPGIADTTYLYHALQRQVPSMISLAAGGAQPNISQNIVKSLSIVLPPLDKQREFAHTIGGLHRTKTIQQAALTELDTLFGSIQYRAFSSYGAGPASVGAGQ